MQEPTGGASEEFVKVCRALADKLDSFDATKGKNSNTSTITVSAGGFAVWLCATFCGVMFALALVGCVLFVTCFQKLDRMQDYWNVTVQYVPGLKEHLETNKEK